MKIPYDQCLNQTVVYWIRKEEHSDILQEGYVGVTHTFTSRMKKHLHSPNEKLKNVFNKYGEDSLIAEIVFEGNSQDCYLLENLMRPSKNIGWNILKGGKLDSEDVLSTRQKKGFINRSNKPPTFDMTTYTSLNEIRNMYYSYIRDLPKAENRGALHRLKYRAAKKMKLYEKGAWFFNNSEGVSECIWRIADVVYETWVSDNYPSDRRLSRLMGYNNRPKTIKSILTEFNMGWIPHEDNRWLEWKEKNKE